jgi:photosystem II stability/assembly factor-like uncharacterized protein
MRFKPYGFHGILVVLPLVFALCSIVFSEHIVAQNLTPTPALTPWRQQNPLPQSNPDSLYSINRVLPSYGVALRTVWFSTLTNGVAVGERGNILATTDGGTTWTARPSPYGSDFYSVFFVNPRRAWALVDRGRGGLATSNDGGQTWTAVNDSISGGKIFFFDEQTGWIAGAVSGALLATTDSGKTWVQQKLPTLNDLTDVVFTSRERGIAIGRGVIFTTTDGGKTWTRLPVGMDVVPDGVRLASISFAGASSGWIAGDDGIVIATTDSGKTWQRQQLPLPTPTTDISKVQFVNANVGFTFDYEENLYTTRDGGKTWLRAYTFPISGFLSDVFFINETTGWATTSRFFFGTLPISGDHHIIWKTTDGGKSWQQVRTSSVSELSSLSLTRSTAFAVGSYTMRTATLTRPQSPSAPSNANPRWNIVVPNQDTLVRYGQQYRAVHAVSEQTAFATGWNSRVARTDDGGQSWKPLTLLEPRGDDSLLGVHFVNERTGWVVGTRHFYAFQANRIYRTDNGGQSWTRQVPAGGFASAPTASLNDVFFVNERTGWVVGAAGTILKTTNGGTTWTQLASPTRSSLYAVFFLNETQGWASGGSDEAAVILYTADGGTTWQRQLAPADGAVRGIAFVDALRGWAVGNRGSILATQNGGATWEQQPSGVATDLYSVGFLSPVQGYVVGDFGTILATSNGGFTPKASVSASRLDFGRVSVRDSAAQSITLDAQFLLEALTITAPAGFTLDYPDAGLRGQRTIRLEPSALATTRATLVVRFSPVADGAVSERLQISSALVNVPTVTLAGIGVNRPVLRLTPPVLEFGVVNVSSFTEATFSIRNIGTTSGTVSFSLDEKLVNSTEASFGGLPQTLLPITIRPGEMQSYALRFTPRTFGLATARLEVRVANGAFDTVYALQLRGTGLQGAAQLSAQRLDFGSVSLTQSTLATLALTNVGNTAAMLQQITLQPQGVFAVRTNPLELVNPRIRPDETLPLQLQYTPRTLGFTRATLTLTTNWGTQSVELVGNGVPLLAAPILETPENRSYNVSTSATFRWSRVELNGGIPMLMPPIPGSPLFTQYDIQISRDSTFQVVDVVENNLRFPVYPPPQDLKTFTQYFWRVKARNGGASSDWSQVAQFLTVRARPLFVSSLDIVRVSGIVGTSKRTFFTISSRERDSVVSARWLVNEGGAFSLRADQFPLLLQRNLTESISLDFAPRESGKVLRGLLQLVGRRDTLLLPVLGIGFDADSTTILTRVAIQTDRTNVVPGDSLIIRLVMTASQNLDVGRNRGKAQTFNAVLRVRNESVLAVARSLMYPAEASSNIELGNGGKIIRLSNIPRADGLKSGILAEIPAQAMLGNAEQTAIEILEFEWTNDTENRIAQSVVDSSVAFVVCTAAGGGQPRLLVRGRAAALVAVAPNPVQNTLEVKYTLLERGNTVLSLVDVLGKRVRTVFEGNGIAGEYSSVVDIGGLAEGAYMLVLQTPTQVLQQRIGVVR